MSPRLAAGEPGEADFVRVHIDRVTPEMVTTTGDATVTVNGTVSNVGDRPVHDVVVRLEHAAEITSPQGLRTSLAGATDAYQPVGDFVAVAVELQRGQSGTFTLSYPLRSASAPALDITEPGVYPLLVNVNGTPDYGEPARLDDGRFLLPVLGVPADPSVESADPVTGVVAPDTSKPSLVTLLWPLADRPRLAAGQPGGGGGGGGGGHRHPAARGPGGRGARG
ncbi:MAG: hypothetical protein ACM4D3_01595, partial [Candidatus Sericytochromatia bacterium]